MALSVNSRPSKTIDNYESTWNAISLPIQYQLESDLFPSNLVDSVYAISSFNNSNGFLRVVISGSPTNISDGETIKMSNSSIESYNGIFKIKEKIANNEYVLNVAYNGVGGVEMFQKYYNNYFTEVRLYAGLPSWHPESLNKPTEIVGTLRVTPDTDNLIIASFSGLIKDDISFDNQLLAGIDIDHFTGFFIEYREGYDEEVNGEIVTAYTTWQQDEISNCGGEIFSNGDFTTDLNGWSQQGTGVSFMWFGGSALAALTNANSNSATIYQEVNLIPNVEYLLTYDINRTNSMRSTFEIIALDDSLNEVVIANDIGDSASTDSIGFTPSTAITYIGFKFRSRLGVVSSDVSINEVNLTATTCQYQFWGSNSSLQFQNIRGGNMYDYIGKDANSQFMTQFEKPTLFRGEYFDVSIILDDNDVLANENTIRNGSILWLNAESLQLGNGDDVLTWEDSSTSGNDFTQAVAANSPKFKSSDSVLNNRASVDFGVGGIEWLDSSLNLPDTFNIYYVINFDDISGARPVIDSDASGRFFIQKTLADEYKYGNTGVNSVITNMVSTGIQYVHRIEYSPTVTSDWFEEVNANDNVTSFPTLATNVVLGSNNINSAGLDGSIGDLIITDGTDPCVDYAIRKYLGDKYNAYEFNGLAVNVKEYENGVLTNESTNDINLQGTGVYRIGVDIQGQNTDTANIQLISASVCERSEMLEVNIDDACSNQEIYLGWLNTLGGWDYWKFTAEKDYNINIEDKVNIERNIFSNWDNTFINGTTQLDTINTTAYPEIDVYSQYLNLEQLQAISQIKYSTRVVLINGDKQTTVIVDSDSITLYNDGDEDTLHTIRFKIRLPNIQVQSQ